MKKLLTLAICLIALPAAAHDGHATGFMAGLAHPFTGLDHLLAMLGVGLWIRQMGMRAAMLATFLVMMALGAFALAALPVAEAGIAASVALIGFAIACAARLPAGAALGLVGVFALLHGQAHGQELPGMASSVGFLLASASLLAGGYALGGKSASRVAGAAIGAAGLGLLAFAA